MSKSRAAIFTTRIALLAGTAAIAVAVPFLGTTTVSAGDETPTPPPTTTTVTPNGHPWSN